MPPPNYSGQNPIPKRVALPSLMQMPTFEFPGFGAVGYKTSLNGNDAALRSSNVYGSVGDGRSQAHFERNAHRFSPYPYHLKPRNSKYYHKMPEASGHSYFRNIGGMQIE